MNPGIYREEFVLRRHRLSDMVRQSSAAVKSPGQPAVLGAHEHYHKHLIIIPAAKKNFMVEKITYFFRQDTDFRYLCGGAEPDCVLVIEVSKDSEKSFLFVREPNLKDEQWEGPRTRPGHQDTCRFFGVQDCLPFSSLGPYLKNFRGDNHEFLLWYDYLNPKSGDVHTVLMDFIQNLDSYNSVESPRRLIHELRLFKSPAEIDLMRHTCLVGATAVKNTIAQSGCLLTEAQIGATVDYHCRMNGAQHLAYPPVVAACDNANIIHYTQCNQSVGPDDLILMDAGCELHGYSSDVTRTWPVSGKFSPWQKIIYEIVLDVQQRLIAKIESRSANLTVDGLYNSMQVMLGEQLMKEGIISETINPGLVTCKANEFCPHHVAHYLGMDVHDTALIPRSIPVQAGMVITIEPGLYLPQKNPDVPKEFRGIGVRIEDDVLITEKGCEVLTEACPRTVQDIEELCRGS